MEKKIIYTTMPNIDDEMEYFEELKENDETSFDDFWEFLYDELDWLYDDFMTDLSAVVSSLRPYDIVIMGMHGRWDGMHEIIPEHADNIKSAIEKCINGEDDFEVSVSDDNKELVVETHNHDASSRYVIRLLTLQAASDLEDYELGEGYGFDFDNRENYIKIY